jgi:glycosyltransferase involved in cell wall biosynthesis
MAPTTDLVAPRSAATGSSSYRARHDLAPLAIARPVRPSVTDRPVRIVRVIARLNIGGPARHVALLERHLPALGYQSWLVHGTPTAGEGELAFEAGPDHAVVRLTSLSRSIRVVADAAALWQIWQMLRRIEPDVVHTHTAKAGALGRMAATCYNLSRPRARRAVLVHTFHGHVFEGYFRPSVGRVVRSVERMLARLTDRIIAISPGQRRDLVERFRIAPASRVVVVPLGLDLEPLARLARDRSSQRATGDADAVVCAFIGRLAPVKHVDLLIRACARAFADEPRGRLLVVGDGECRADLEALAARLGLAGKITFAGWQTDLQALYAGVDLVALSSLNEGTPVALIEAMAAGCAVVATAVGGVPDVVDDGRTGRLVAPGDESALAAAIAELIGDVELRARLGAAARAEALARFGYARLVADVDRVYREALEAARSVAGR